MVPEPYWDINMGQEFNFSQLKFYLNKALKVPLTVKEVEHIQKAVWGQGFSTPVFSESLTVVSQRIVGEKHLALKLKHQGQPVDGIWFGRTEPLPNEALLAFKLETDNWQGQRRVRFLIEGAAL